MSQENAAAKARHYLSEGRLTVRQVDRSGVVAVVCGHSGLVYMVESSPDLVLQPHLSRVGSARLSG
jgi:hypothetical protein